MTRDQLASLLGRGLSFLTVLPQPDAVLETADRTQLLGWYRGFADDLLPACVTLSNAAVTILTLGVEPCA